MGNVFSSFSEGFMLVNKPNLRVEITASDLVTLNAKIEAKLAIFCRRDLEIGRITLKKNRASLQCSSNSVHHVITICEFQLNYRPETLKSGWWFFGSCDLEVGRLTSPLLSPLQLGASFHSICKFKLELSSGNAEIWARIFPFFPLFVVHVNLKFKGWPGKQ